MVWGTKEALEEKGSAARASTSQPAPAGPSQTAANGQCPICLGNIRNAAYVAFCLHRFCFACIRQWGTGSDDCALCRQPFERVLHSVRADDDYTEYVVGSPARRRRNAARIRSRSPQRRYSLRRRPAAGGGHRGQRDNTPPGPSCTASQQAAPASAPQQQPPPSAAERLDGPAAAPCIRPCTVCLQRLTMDRFP